MEVFAATQLNIKQDSNCKVYVLECNIMPSLATGNTMDKAVKNRLLAHLLTLVGAAPFDREEVTKEEQMRTYHQSSREISMDITVFVLLFNVMLSTLYEIIKNRPYLHLRERQIPNWKKER